MKGECRICFNIMINENSEGKKINLSSNLVLVGLDFLDAKGTTTVAMQIFWFPVKIGFSLSKKRTNFSLKVVPVGLDFLVAKCTVIIAVQIYNISCKIMSIKNYGIKFIVTSGMTWYQLI